MVSYIAPNLVVSGESAGYPAMQGHFGCASAHFRIRPPFFLFDYCGGVGARENLPRG